VVEATFSCIPADCLEAILTSPIGSRLLSLKIEDLPATPWASGNTETWEGMKFDLFKLLSPCKQLQELVIEDSPSLIEETTVVPFAYSKCPNFLPNLKSLEVSCCLGQWSRVFETELPSLTNLRLNCSHLGVETVSEYLWSDASKLWPNLRQLHVGYANGLSEMTYDKVLQSFDKLKEVTIPR